MYKLYHHPASQHARRVHALLEAADLKYELIHVSFEEGEHLGDKYLTINPNHQIPALNDGDVTMSQSNAIMRYICHKHQLEDWYPTSLQKRATVEQWLDWAQCLLSPAVINIVFYTVFAPELDNQEAIKQGHEKMKELTPILSAALDGKQFLAGDTPTIADIAIASNITQLSFADAVPKDANIINWMERVCAIPGVMASLPKKEAA